MSPEEARRYVDSLYRNVLKRAPATKEFDYWVSRALSDMSTLQVYYAFIDSKEYRSKSNVASIFPPGHYYSPIVDPRRVVDYVKREQAATADIIHGIAIPLQTMLDLWTRLSSLIR